MATSIEIRINSVDDARAVIADLVAVHDKIKSTGADSVELKIAQECVKEANKLLYGVFRVKVFTSVVTCLNDRVLFVPRPFVLQETLV